MDLLAEFSRQAQTWHETDHGTRRGKPIKGNKFIQPGEDDVPASVPEKFLECPLCRPCSPDWSMAPHSNPFWYRVVAWGSDD